jgi:hypothetical protein
MSGTKRLENAIRQAMKHRDVLGAGAEKRKSLPPEGKFEAVMREYKRGTLRSGSGEHVKKRAQALAIAFSEKRKG